MRNSLTETIMGTVVLLVAGSFLYYAFSHANISSSDGYDLNIRFDKVGGLSVGSDVKISGIKVGSVTNQYLDPDTFEAVVTINLSDDIEIPEDTFASITAEGLLGGNYLSLDPGGSDEMLVAGDEITETQGAVDLLGLLDKFAGSGDE